MVNPKKAWNRLDNHTRLLSLLKQHGELRFHDLKEKLKVSEPTLTEYIKSLEIKQQIEAFFKPEDRRQKWYRIKPQSAKNVESQIGKYEAIKFIEEMENPIYVHQEKSGSAVAVFYTGEWKTPTDIGKIVKGKLEETQFMHNHSEYPNVKLAMVLMIKPKGGAKAE